MRSAARKCLSFAFALLVVLLPVFSSAQMPDRLYADEGKFFRVMPVSGDGALDEGARLVCLWQDGDMTYAAVCTRGRFTGTMHLTVGGTAYESVYIAGLEGDLVVASRAQGSRELIHAAAGAMTGDSRDGWLLGAFDYAGEIGLTVRFSWTPDPGEGGHAIAGRDYYTADASSVTVYMQSNAPGTFDLALFRREGDGFVRETAADPIRLTVGASLADASLALALPVGEYKLVLANADAAMDFGYISTAVTGTAGSVAALSDAIGAALSVGSQCAAFVSFSNRYAVTRPQEDCTLTVTKAVDAPEGFDAQREYVFVIRDSDGRIARKFSLYDGGSIKIDSLIAGKTYSISELDAAVGGYQSAVTVSGATKQNGGSFVALSGNLDVRFVNTYKRTGVLHVPASSIPATGQGTRALALAALMVLTGLALLVRLGGARK